MAVRVAMMWPMVLGESRAYGIISVFLGALSVSSIVITDPDCTGPDVR